MPTSARADGRTAGPAAPGTDWFRLFGNVRFKILCAGDRSEELARTLIDMHGQDAISTRDMESMAVGGGPFDMVCLADGGTQRESASPRELQRAFEALKPGGWLYLKASSALPGLRARKVALLKRRLATSGFCQVDTIIVYPNFEAPLMVMRPHRGLSVFFFKHVHQPRTFRAMVESAAFRTLLPAFGPAVLPHSLVLARKA